MTNDAKINAPISAAMSSSAAPKSENEGEFLTRQAKDAASAIPHLFKEFKENALETVDPRLWARDHPWASVGVVIAGAFTAASFVIPSRRRARAAAAAKSDEPTKRHRRKRRKQKSWKQQLIREAIAIVGPALSSAVASVVKCKSEPSAEHDGNGHA